MFRISAVLILRLIFPSGELNIMPEILGSAPTIIFGAEPISNTNVHKIDNMLFVFCSFYTTLSLKFFR